MSIDSDLDFMLGDWGSRDVTIGTYRGQRPLEEADVLDTDRSGEPVMVRHTVIRLRRSDHLDESGVCTITRGMEATVDGVAYSVTDVRVGDGDGAELLALVRKV